MPKRETSLGEHLKQARLASGLTAGQLREKIKREYRAEIGKTTIYDLEKDKIPNPGLKTLELVCLGLGLDPLEMFKLILDDPPELALGFTKSQIAQFWERYSRLDKSRRAFYDETIKMLIEKIDRER